MEPFKLLEKFYYANSNTYQYLITHSRAVADKALRGAEKVRHLNPDMQFIEEAALLHDVGIFMVNAPKIGCIGPNDYIAHGYLGRELLDKVSKVLSKSGPGTSFVAPTPPKDGGMWETRSPRMQELAKMVEKVAARDVNVWRNAIFAGNGQADSARTNDDANAIACGRSAVR